MDSERICQVSQCCCTVRMITATMIKRKAQLVCGCVVVRDAPSAAVAGEKILADLCHLSEAK